MVVNVSYYEPIDLWLDSRQDLIPIYIKGLGILKDAQDLRQQIDSDVSNYVSYLFQPSDKVSITEKDNVHKLVVKDSSPDASGEYKLVAKNEAGELSAAANVKM